MGTIINSKKNNAEDKNTEKKILNFAKPKNSLTLSDEMNIVFFGSPMSNLRELNQYFLNGKAIEQNEKAINFEISCYEKTWKQFGNVINLKIWLIPIGLAINWEIVHKSCGIAFVYNICDRESQCLIPGIKESISESFLFAYILLGNQKQRAQNIEMVSFDEGKSMADSWVMPFYEVSWQTGENVDRAFKLLIETSLEKKKSNRGIIIDW